MGKKFSTITNDYSFDEFELAKHYFAFDKEVSSVINAMTKNGNSNKDYMSLVCKYLMYGNIYETKEEKEKYQHPQMVRELMWKYAIIMIYKMIISYKNFVRNDFYVENMEVFRDEIKLKDLIEYEFDKNTYIGQLYFQETSDVLPFEIKKIIEDTNFNKTLLNSIESLLKWNFKYFTKSNSISFYDVKNSTNFDLIVCETITNKDFQKFSFTIDEDADEFVKNFVDTQKSGFKLSACIVYLGYVIDELIRDNNYYPESIPNAKNTLCQMRTTHKEFSTSYFNFLVKDGLSLVIDYDKVVPFRFTYNGKKYCFDNEGIKEI